MGMTACRLNRCIQVQRYRITGPGTLRAEGVWEDHGSTIRARRRDVSDGERRVAGVMDNRLLTRFVVRSSLFTKSISRNDRIVHDGFVFDIDGIKEWPDSRAFLEISAISKDVP